MAEPPDNAGGLHGPRRDGVRTVDVAVTGMAGRFPGADGVDALWRNLCDGVESVSFFTDEELRSAGATEDALRDPAFVRAAGIVDEAEDFDAGYFSMLPTEALITDPQHRVLMECAAAALDDAGCNPETFAGLIGVYAGASANTYRSLVEASGLPGADPVRVALGNDRDFIATRTSYKLGLAGPSMTIQTACSTSLVATHVACQQLLAGECDVALAGGVSIRVPQVAGYRYREGDILSPDGHCRAFDADARGTVDGNGVGVIVLKRLADAIADGDNVRAVIKGSAINNDGGEKVDYMAPNVNGQAKAIAEALAVAEVPPETIGYVEAHGTGTRLGDPIEISALTKAFALPAGMEHTCPVGSVKSNLGHLDAAAGIAGLIKAILIVERRAIPPSLNYERPNPEIDFERTPFYVNTELTPAKNGQYRLCVGVSSFGIGGTNAHMVIEEGPPTPESSGSTGWHIVPISARTDAAVGRATEDLAEHLRANPKLDSGDVAHTLQVGRRQFDHRRAIIARTLGDVERASSSRDQQRVLRGGPDGGRERGVAFMFPGQGSQRVDMARELYEGESVFRHWIDSCADLLRAHIGFDLRAVLFPKQSAARRAAEELRQTAVTQPALFTVEYALAKLWIARGVVPEATIGHSVGEYVAACLAGVFSLEDALGAVSVRGRMIQAVPAGDMLSVALSEDEALKVIAENEGVDLAAVNSPSLCVLSGPAAEMARLHKKLEVAGIRSRKLRTSHAFHSRMVDGVLEPFADELSRLTLNRPRMPFVSNVSGTWIEDDEAQSPAYWAAHIRSPVRFGEGVERLASGSRVALLEVGPGRALSTLAAEAAGGAPVAPSLASDDRGDLASVASAHAQLWLAGVEVNWGRLQGETPRQRVSLPGYPFERKRFTVEPDGAGGLDRPISRARLPIEDWFRVPGWRRTPLPPAVPDDRSSGRRRAWLVFCDQPGVGVEIAELLERGGDAATLVRPGRDFRDRGTEIEIDPLNDEDHRSLLAYLRDRDAYPSEVIYLWSTSALDSPDDELGDSVGAARRSRRLTFHGLLGLARALGAHAADPTTLTVITTNACDVTGDDLVHPSQALTAGACRVISREYANVRSRVVDIDESELRGHLRASVVRSLVEEASVSEQAMVAYRGQHRWVETFEPVRLPRRPAPDEWLADSGAYLITGGLGGIGLTIARYIAEVTDAGLALVGRSALPPPDSWGEETREDHPGPVAEALEHLLAITAAGTDVRTYAGDVSDEERLREIVRRVESDLGSIRGVIHAAGVPGDGIIELKSAEQAESVLAPKVDGTIALQRVLGDRPSVDFILLVSSLNAVLGEIGQVDYAAANAFMDATASRQRADGPRLISINWDSWREVGMSARAERALGMDTDPSQGLSPAEGVDALARAMAARLPRLVICTTDLESRQVAIDRERTKPAPGPPIADQDAATVAGAATAASLEDCQKRIRGVWAELLGIDDIGPEDDFFGLGGHSWLAVEITARIRSALGVDLPLREFLNSPTVAGLAAAVHRRGPAEADLERLEGALADTTKLEQFR